MKSSKKPISASELGMAVKCPASVAHKYAGTKVSKASAQRMEAGNQSHEKFNETLKAEARDPRCYVATMLYGQNGVETNLLRQFRDHHLLTNRAGRWFVGFYYRYSPKLVAYSLCYPILHKLAHICVSTLVFVLSTFADRNSRNKKGQK